MTASRTLCLSLALLLTSLSLAGCGSAVVEGGSEEAVVLAFDMNWSTMQPFTNAWNAARDNPATGVDFDFPVMSDGIEPGTEVRLYVGRSTTEGLALETGGDVILKDSLHVATAMLDEPGKAEFGPLEVAEVSFSSGTNTIDFSYLCGQTVIVARAFRNAEGDVPGAEFLAATWFHAVTPPCE